MEDRRAEPLAIGRDEPRSPDEAAIAALASPDGVECCKAPSFPKTQTATILSVTEQLDWQFA
jgi:hypothetical protein